MQETEQKKNNSSDYQKNLMEQYKLYVESADRNSQRRTETHRFFLTTNTTLLGLVILFNHTAYEIDFITKIMIAIAGIACSIAWRSLIQSYADLNTGKFTVINNMEKELPYKPYTEEWDVLLKQRQHVKNYVTQSKVEFRFIKAFIILYALLMLSSTINLIIENGDAIRNAFSSFVNFCRNVQQLFS